MLEITSEPEKHPTEVVEAAERRREQLCLRDVRLKLTQYHTKLMLANAMST